MLWPIEALLVRAHLLDLALARLVNRLLALLVGVLLICSLEFELDTLSVADCPAQLAAREPDCIIATCLDQHMGVGDLDDLAGYLSLRELGICDAKCALLSLHAPHR